jgi:hypothetical protein
MKLVNITIWLQLANNQICLLKCKGQGGEQRHFGEFRLSQHLPGVSVIPGAGQGRQGRVCGEGDAVLDLP